MNKELNLTEIFRLAHIMQTNIWASEARRLQEDHNQLALIRERNAWHKLEDIEKMADQLGIEF